MDKSDKCAQKWGRPVQELTIAMNALLSKPPNFELAGGAICTAEIQNMRCQGGIPKWLVEKSKTSPIMATNIGLLCAFMVWVTLSIVLYYMIMSSGATLQAVQTPLGSILIVASCAFLGGITSMLMKVNEHARMTRVDLSLLFWTGLFKPFVGLFLGCVLFAIIQTALAGFGGATVPTNDPQKYFYFLIVIGFIAGFSERFAADAITRATPALGGGSGVARIKWKARPRRHCCILQTEAAARLS